MTLNLKIIIIQQIFCWHDAQKLFTYFHAKIVEYYCFCLIDGPFCTQLVGACFNKLKNTKQNNKTKKKKNC